MRKHFLSWILAFFLSTVSTARAAGAQASSSAPATTTLAAADTAANSVGACVASAQPYQPALTACADSAYHAAHAVLARAYRRRLGSLSSPADRAKLRAAQRAWLRFRDAQCTFEAAAYDRGSMQPMIESFCLETLTRARARQVVVPRTAKDEHE